MREDWNQLARYLAGECSAEEAEAITRRIESDAELRRQMDELRSAWDAAAEPSTDTQWDTRSAWQRLTARARARERRRHLGIVRPMAPRHGAGRSWRVAAAAAAVIIAVGGGLLWNRTSDQKPQVVTAPALREIRTVPGQRAVLTLGDGSRVVLGPSSVLRYDTTMFGVSSRTLQLDGEAHFTVAHMGDKAPVFAVRTARGTVRDIGTAFNVKDFAGRQRAGLEVVVSDGSVDLRGRVLTRGDLARVNEAGDMQVRRGVDVDRHIAWTTGRLVFDDVPLRDAIPDLERWYDLDVRIADASVARRRLVATLREGAASSALDLLEIALNVRAERRGRVVTLYSRN